MQNLFKAIRLFFIGIYSANRAQKLYNSKKYHECIAFCTETIKKDAKDFFAYYYRGLSQYELKFLEESRLDMIEAIDLKPNSFSGTSTSEYKNFLKHKICKSLRRERKYDEAISNLNEYIIEDIRYVYFYILKSYIYSDLNETIKAIESINEGLKAIPNSRELKKLKKSYSYDYSVEQNTKRMGG